MSTTRSYHHPDLRSALIEAAVELLESGEAFSLRAVARRAGVSQTAPYRHFADRSALDNAVAVRGFTALTAQLQSAADAAPDSAQAVLGSLAFAYVRFALQRPAQFRLMFGNECDDEDAERVVAAEGMHALLRSVLERLFPGLELSDLATALWAMAHGLAFLHLDGKLRPEPLDEVDARVRRSVAAILAMNSPGR